MNNPLHGKRVLITGHTGFKGGWLTILLADLGAEVHGFAQDPPTSPCLFEVAKIRGLLASNHIADVRDYASVRTAMQVAQPELVFHLAAQPLVRRSYRQPLETIATNVLGTANVLHAITETPTVRAVINVTSDKCYENQEHGLPYRESDAMGGHDPYSASKGCAELLTTAWRRSFLKQSGVRVASARAGNVIGGGDWAEDRLLPDFLRSIDNGRELVIRSPKATRPWQHVLEPLTGYLMLAKKLLGEDGDSYAQGWNFGPKPEDTQTVEWVARQLTSRVDGSRFRTEAQATLHEASQLSLDSSKAQIILGWRPTWDAEQALTQTIAWHKAWKTGADMRAITLSQAREHGAYVSTFDKI